MCERERETEPRLIEFERATVICSQVCPLGEQERDVSFLHLAYNPTFRDHDFVVAPRKR